MEWVKLAEADAAATIDVEPTEIGQSPVEVHMAPKELQDLSAPQNAEARASSALNAARG